MDAMNMRGEYEFEESENRIIGKAALWAKILAIVMFVEAVVENTHLCPGVDQYFLTSHFRDLFGCRRRSIRQSCS